MVFSDDFLHFLIIKIFFFLFTKTCSFNTKILRLLHVWKLEQYSSLNVVNFLYFNLKYDNYRQMCADLHAVQEPHCLCHLFVHGWFPELW